MATRATVDFKNGLVKSYTIAATKAATAGYPAIFSGADDAVENGGAGTDLAFGVFLDTGTAGDRVRVLVPGPIVEVVVGTGGATRGTKAVMVSDGFTDAPAHDSSGGTDNQIYGIFMQTGVATDKVGLQLAISNRGSA